MSDLPRGNGAASRGRVRSSWVAAAFLLLAAVPILSFMSAGPSPHSPAQAAPGDVGRSPAPAAGAAAGATIIARDITGDYHPAVVVSGERALVAWVTFDAFGFGQVYASILNGGRPGAAARLSSDFISNLDPAVTRIDGGWCAAWPGFFATTTGAAGNRSPELLATCKRDAEPQWPPPMVVDRARSSLVSVRIVAVKGQPVLAYVRDQHALTRVGVAGGARWSVERPITGPGEHVGWLDAAGGPMLHVAYDLFRPVVEVRYRASRTGGRHWSGPVTVGRAAPAYFPSVATTGSRVAVVWGGGGDAIWAAKTGAGATWEAAARIDRGLPVHDLPGDLAGDGRTLVATWGVRNAPGRRVVVAAVLSGNSWEQPRAVTPPGEIPGPAAVALNRGRLYVVYFSTARKQLLLRSVDLPAVDVGARG